VFWRQIAAFERMPPNPSSNLVPRGYVMAHYGRSYPQKSSFLDQVSVAYEVVRDIAWHVIHTATATAHSMACCTYSDST